MDAAAADRWFADYTAFLNGVHAFRVRAETGRDGLPLPDGTDVLQYRDRDELRGLWSLACASVGIAEDAAARLLTAGKDGRLALLAEAAAPLGYTRAAIAKFEGLEAAMATPPRYAKLAGWIVFGTGDVT